MKTYKVFFFLTSVLIVNCGLRLECKTQQLCIVFFYLATCFESNLKFVVLHLGHTGTEEII